MKIFFSEKYYNNFNTKKLGINFLHHDKKQKQKV